MRKAAAFEKKTKLKYIYIQILYVYSYFFIFTCRDDEVTAAASLDYDPAVSAVAQRLSAGKVITKKEAEYVKSVLMLLSSKCRMTGVGHAESFIDSEQTKGIRLSYNVYGSLTVIWQLREKISTNTNDF